MRDEACHEVLPTPSLASEAFGVVGSLPRSDRRRGYRFIAPVAFHRDFGLVAAGAQLASLVREEGLAVHGQLLPAERAQKVLRVPRPTKGFQVRATYRPLAASTHLAHSNEKENVIFHP